MPCGTLITFQLQVTANEGSWNDSFTVRVGVQPISQTTYPSTDTPKPLPDFRTPPVLSSIVVASTGRDLRRQRHASTSATPSTEISTSS